MAVTRQNKNHNENSSRETEGCTSLASNEALVLKCSIGNLAPNRERVVRLNPKPRRLKMCRVPTPTAASH